MSRKEGKGRPHPSSAIWTHHSSSSSINNNNNKPNNSNSNNCNSKSSNEGFKGCLGKRGRASHTHLLPSGRTTGVPSSFATGNTTITTIFLTITTISLTITGCCTILLEHAWFHSRVSYFPHRLKMAGTCLLHILIASQGMEVKCFPYGSRSWLFHCSELDAQAEGDFITVLHCTAWVFRKWSFDV